VVLLQYIDKSSTGKLHTLGDIRNLQATMDLFELLLPQRLNTEIRIHSVGQTSIEYFTEIPINNGHTR